MFLVFIAISFWELKLKTGKLCEMRENASNQAINWFLVLNLIGRESGDSSRAIPVQSPIFYDSPLK